MRCFEIRWRDILKEDFVKLNNNMRCFEMKDEIYNEANKELVKQ